MPEIILQGTKEEQNLFMEVKSHTDMSEDDLQDRIQRRNGFDDSDKIFLNHIDENTWPFQAVTADPRISTAIYEKNFRLIANKPKGRLVPREGGDELGAQINNELLSFQWDDVSRVDGDPMVAKWQLMDLNVRRYGAGFGIATWRYETQAKMEDGEKKKKTLFDGPYFKVIDPRNVLANPSYSVIKNWFQYREFTTFKDLENINDASRSQPKYKNLDLLRDALQQRELSKKGGDGRQAQYLVKNKTIRGLEDFMGKDWVYKSIEIVTEMTPNRWVTYAPKHGVILRDIPNPYNHGEIPAIMLRYYPLGDDLYGLSEIEQGAKLQKAINALICQYLDAVNSDLYPPIVVDPTRVNMHTLEFGPNAKWQVSGDINTALKRLETSTAATSNFTQTYSLLVASLQNTLGETSAAYSNLKPGGSEKTATEIKETAFTKSIRDNANQIFLAEAIKRQYMLWHSMNQQYLFKGGENAKVIRIAGKEAVRYFQEQGLDQYHPTDEEVLSGMDVTELGLEDTPVYPAEVNGSIQPKFDMDIGGNSGNLVVEKDDLQGSYDFIPDIESMQPPSNDDVSRKLTEFIAAATNPVVQQGMMQTGDTVKWKDLLVKMAENGKILKDADQFFTTLQMQTNPLGGVPGQMPQPGMAPSPLEQGGLVNDPSQQGFGPQVNPIGAPVGQAGFSPTGAF